MKQGGHEQVCSACHANLTLGEVHDPDCEYAAREHAWDEDGESEYDEEDEEEDW